MNKPNLQVQSTHYLTNYNKLPRWNSYWYQIKRALELKPKNILEIGIGDSVVSSYLKRSGIIVSTCDIDKDLRPDLVADVRKLPFNKPCFDLVMCCQVLEHLPFREFIPALGNIRTATKKYVILSLPFYSPFISISIKIAKINPLNFCLRFPFPVFRNKFDGHHYWEINKRGYSIGKIRKAIRRAGFEILKQGTPPLKGNHYFFILKKVEIH